jgi:hypothetical protein
VEADTFDEEPSKGKMTSLLSIMNVLVNWKVYKECEEVEKVVDIVKAEEFEVMGGRTEPPRPRRAELAMSIVFWIASRRSATRLLSSVLGNVPVAEVRSFNLPVLEERLSDAIALWGGWRSTPSAKDKKYMIAIVELVSLSLVVN